jgi:hypothetical protein
MIRKSRMVLAAPGPLLTPPPSSSPPKTPHRSYSAQTRYQAHYTREINAVYSIALAHLTLARPHFGSRSVRSDISAKCDKNCAIALIATDARLEPRQSARERFDIAGSHTSKFMAQYTQDTPSFFLAPPGARVHPCEMCHKRNAPS